MRKKALLVCAMAVAAFGVAGCTATTTSESNTVAVEKTGEDAVQEDTQADAQTDSQADTQPDSQEETTAEATEESSEEAATEEEMVAISSDEANAMLMSVLGEQEDETGNTYSYDYIENVQVNGVTYLVFEWSVAEDENVSKISDLFVTADGKAVYQGAYSGPDSSDVYLDQKMN